MDLLRTDAGEHLAAAGLDVQCGTCSYESIAKETLVPPRWPLFGGPTVEPGEVPAVRRHLSCLLDGASNERLMPAFHQPPAAVEPFRALPPSMTTDLQAAAFRRGRRSTVEVLTVRLDVDDEASVGAAVAAAGHVDALVNNAGFGVIGPVETVPLEPVQRMFDTNVFGLLRMVQAVAPQMRARRSGTIVNVSSVAGREHQRISTGCTQQRSTLSRRSAMHDELTHFGIRTVVVEPGYVRSSWSASEQWLGVGAPYLVG